MDETADHPQRPPPAEATAVPRTGTWRNYLIVFGLALLLYGLSMAPGVLWQDSGLAQVRTLRGDFVGEDFDGPLGLALSHPLYYVFTSAAHWLPFGNPAWRTNLVSVIFGAITVANVFLFLLLRTRRLLPAICGTLAVAFAHTFWQHCALAEVYTLTTALLSAELLCLQRFDSSRNGRWLILLALLNGLGVSNHLFALLSLAVFGVAAIYLLARKQLAWSMLLPAGFAWLVGAGLYIGLIVHQGMVSADWPATLQSALFGDYQRHVTNPAPTAHLLKNSVLVLAMNFPTPFALMAIGGGIHLVRTRNLASRVLLGLLTIHLLFAVRYDVPDQYTFFIPSIVVLGVVMGLGVAATFNPTQRKIAGAAVLCAMLPALVYIPLPTIARDVGMRLGSGREVPFRDTYDYFLHPWKSGEDGPALFGQAALAAMPDGAVLFADSTTARPIQYFLLTEPTERTVTLLSPKDPAHTEASLRDKLDAGKVFVVTPMAPQYCPTWLADRYKLEEQGVLYRAAGRKE